MSDGNKVQRLRFRIAELVAENNGLRGEISVWVCPKCERKYDFGPTPDGNCEHCSKPRADVKLVPETTLALRLEEAMAGIVAGALRSACIKIHSQHCKRDHCIADQKTGEMDVPDERCVEEVDALIKIELDATARKIIANGQPK